MVFTIEYKRTIRVRPYETVTIGLLEEFDALPTQQDSCYQSIKVQVDYWVDQAREEFGGDELSE